MDVVSIYTALLGQKKLKEQFVKELREVLKRNNKSHVTPGKLSFVRYSELKSWSIREITKENELCEGDQALIDKIYHMLLIKHSDFESVIRMLHSFRNGTKAGMRVHYPEDNYKWTYKDGNPKLSTYNLPKAHFRWNWTRYVLSDESVNKITDFVDKILES